MNKLYRASILTGLVAASIVAYQVAYAATSVSCPAPQHQVCSTKNGTKTCHCHSSGQTAHKTHTDGGAAASAADRSGKSGK
jgi:hypothetical protein